MTKILNERDVPEVKIECGSVYGHATVLCLRIKSKFRQFIMILVVQSQG